MAINQNNNVVVAPPARNFNQILEEEFKVPSTGASKAGKTLYVDSVFGRDTTGARQTDSPFLTLAAAKTAALSGDTIIVRPGSYAAASIGKNGVNIHLMNGVTLTNSTAVAIIDDSAAGANADLVFNLTGEGIFSATGDAPVIYMTRAGSSINIACCDIAHTGSTGTSLNRSGVWQTAGNISVHCNNIRASTSPIYWSGGEMSVKATNIVSTAGGNALYLQVSSGSPNFFCDADFIDTAGGAVQLTGSTTARAWVTARHIRAGASTVENSGGKLYVNAQKLECMATTSSTSVIVTSSLAGTWITAAKATIGSASETNIEAMFTLGGVAYITLQSCENAGTLAHRVFSFGNGTTAAVDVCIGNFVQTQDAPMSSAAPLTSSGRFHIRNSRIDTSSFPSRPALSLPASDGNIILDNCTFIADLAQVSLGVEPQVTTDPDDWDSGTAYIEADTATYGGIVWTALADNTNVTPAEGATWTKGLATVKVYGTCVASTAKHANITVQVNPVGFIVDSNVT